MLTDYKFWYINRDDNGFITEVAVRFYEGAISTVPITDIKGITTNVDKYIRTTRLQATDLTYLDTQDVKKEVNGNDAIVFTSKDFGEISSDGDLRLFLNAELAKDPSRMPIDEQK